MTCSLVLYLDEAQQMQSLHSRRNKNHNIYFIFADIEKDCIALKWITDVKRTGVRKYPVSKIAEKSVCSSVFFTTWHFILSAN